MEIEGNTAWLTIEEQRLSGLHSPRALSEPTNLEPAMAEQLSIIEESNITAAKDDDEITPVDRAVAHQRLINATRDMGLLRLMDKQLNPKSFDDYFSDLLGDN